MIPIRFRQRGRTDGRTTETRPAGTAAVGLREKTGGAKGGVGWGGGGGERQ